MVVLVYSNKFFFHPLQKLFLELELDRPVNPIDYVARRLRNIANEVLYTKARVHIPSYLSKEGFIKSFATDFNVPTVVFKPKNKYSTSEILQKTKLFLQQHNLNKKHAIYLNFPQKCKDSREFLENNLSPSTVVEVNLESDYCLDTSLRDYYGRLHHRIYVKSNTCPQNSEAKESVNEVMIHLMNILRTTKIPPAPYLRGCYYPRVLILGRTGSGRRTQANYLVSRFNLIKSINFVSFSN